MSTDHTFTPQVLGQAEKALNAILDRELAGTGVSEAAWVTLTLAVTGGGPIGRDQLVERISFALKVGDAQAVALIGELARLELLDDPDTDGAAIRVTEGGLALFGRIRVAVTQITERMWGDLPAEDLAASGRVLSIVLERANRELIG